MTSPGSRTIAEVFVPVHPDTRTTGEELHRSLSNDPKIKRAGEATGKQFGAGMHTGVNKVIPGIAKGLVAGFAALKGIQVFSGFIADAQESARVTRLTENVIKTTGGAAKVTANQVGDLAQALSNKTGIDDENVQSGANLLLTFKNIKREGTGLNDVFGRANAAALDLSAAGFGDINGASKQLGKALNDPVKGLTALGKAGVTFSDKQKDQIKTLVKTGDVLGAQKIILKEVESQVGGAAAAAADPITKLKTILLNVGEDIGTALLPYIDKLATWLGERLPKALVTVKGWFTQAKIAIDALVGGFRDGDITSDGFIGAMEQIGSTAKASFDFFKTNVLPILKDVAGFIVNILIPALADLGGWLIKNRSWLIPIVAGIAAMAGSIYVVVTAIKVWQAVTKAFAAVQLAFNLIMLANPIGLIAIAVIGLITALVVAYKTSDRFRAVVDTSFRVVWDIIKTVWNWVKDNWPLILGFLTGPIGLAVAIIVKHWDTIKAGAKKMWDAVKSGASSAISFVLDMIDKLLGAFQTTLEFMGRLPGPFGKPFREMAEKIQGARDKVGGLKKSIDSLKPKVIPVTVAIKGIDVTALPINQGRKLGVDRLAAAYGGFIPGNSPGDRSDNVPAMLTAGEFVIQKPTARAMERKRPGILTAINAGRVDIGGDAGTLRVSAGQPLTFAGGGSVLAVQNFIRSTDPLPYVWGAAGPGSYDCSGLQSAVFGKLTGKGGGGGQRYFTTDTIGPGLRPGTGMYTIGVTPGRGHMVGQLGTLKFEARSTASGIIVGNAASSPTKMARQFFLPSLGGVLGGTAGLTTAQLRSAIKQIRPQIVREIMRNLGVRADTGGYLSPGWNPPIYNGTGRLESVRTGAQEDSIAGELRALRLALAAQPVIVEMDSRPIARAVRNQNTRNTGGW